MNYLVYTQKEIEALKAAELRAYNVALNFSRKSHNYDLINYAERKLDFARLAYDGAVEVNYIQACIVEEASK